jgi:hypothetical protein
MWGNYTVVNLYDSHVGNYTVINLYDSPVPAINFAS